MKVVKTDFVAGAQQAKGIVVIIDVFRAFSVACYCLDAGVNFVAPVGAIEQAIAFKEQYPDALLIGERNGEQIAGFDFGNSPSQIQQAEITDAKVFHTTHAGTQGLVNAIHADQIVTGALVNAEATARYIKSQNPELVTLVRMGWKAEEQTDEDNVCADYLEALLLNQPYDGCGIKQRLSASPCSERFFAAEVTHSPEQDFHLCTELNKFDFAVIAERSELGFWQLKKQTS